MSQRPGHVKPLSDDATEKEAYIYEKSVEFSRWRAALEWDKKMTREHEAVMKVHLIRCQTGLS